MRHRQRHLSSPRRGIAPIVSTMLMVVVVVAAASIAVLWSSGALQTLANYFGTQSNAVQEAIAIEDVFYNRTTAANAVTLRPYVRNIGPVAVILKAVIVSWPGGTPKLLNAPANLILGGGQMTSALSFTPSTFMFSSPFGPCPTLPASCGKTFTIQVITALGTSDSFQLFVA
jgi:flagellin-like protein